MGNKALTVAAIVLLFGLQRLVVFLQNGGSLDSFRSIPTQLFSDDDKVRQKALARVERLDGAATAELLPVLEAAFGAAEPRKKWYAANAAEKLGPRAAKIAPRLAKNIKDDEYIVRRSALLALAAIGPEAYPHIQENLRGITNDEGEVNVGLQAIADRYPVEGSRFLVQLMQDESLTRFGYPCMDVLNTQGENGLNAVREAISSTGLQSFAKQSVSVAGNEEMKKLLQQ